LEVSAKHTEGEKVMGIFDALVVIIMLIASQIIGELISVINNLEDQLKEKE